MLGRSALYAHYMNIWNSSCFLCQVKNFNKKMMQDDALQYSPFTEKHYKFQFFIAKQRTTKVMSFSYKGYPKQWRDTKATHFSHNSPSHVSTYISCTKKKPSSAALKLFSSMASSKKDKQFLTMDIKKNMTRFLNFCH